MDRGRPIRDRRNNWNNQWLPYMRRIATDVLSQFPYRQGSVIEDDLVNTAWLATARRVDPALPCKVMGKWVRRCMVLYLVGLVDRRCVSLDHLTDPECDPGVFVSRPDYKDFDGLLDAVEQVSGGRVADRMACLHAGGMTLREIGRQYNLTGERVRQLIAETQATSIERNR